MNKLLIILFLPTVLLGQSIERQVIGSAGGVMKSQNICISYTIGEAFVSYHNNGNILMSEGFQQGEITQLTDIGIEEEDDGIDIEIYPNPTTGSVTLKIEEKDIESKYTVAVFNIENKLLFMDVCNGTDKYLNIDMTGYAPGLYIVGVAYGIKNKVVLIEKIR
tara:strand:- start:7052 stop:7540 length:489 start_codon:yes stop_codon:yes gene_type:complete